MWNDLDKFDNVFPTDPNRGQPASPGDSPRRRKTAKELAAFWALNAVAAPAVGMVYLSVGAHGARQLLEVTQLRLYQMPLPGIGVLRRYDGWDRLDLALVFAGAMCLAVSVLWYRIFSCLQTAGALASKRERTPALFYLHAAISGVVIFCDAGLFFVGLSSSSDGWTNTPGYVPLLATALFTASIALWGAWHSDFNHSRRS